MALLMTLKCFVRIMTVKNDQNVSKGRRKKRSVYSKFESQQNCNVLETRLTCIASYHRAVCVTRLPGFPAFALLSL